MSAGEGAIVEPGVAEVRTELGVSQSGLAALLGCSVRAVQSYEQGWRKPPDHVRRSLLLLLVARRRGRFSIVGWSKGPAVLVAFMLTRRAGGIMIGHTGPTTRT